MPTDEKMYVKIFDIEETPEDFDPDNPLNIMTDERYYNYWRSEVYVNLEEGDEFFTIMAYYGFDVFSAKNYSCNHNEYDNKLNGVLRFWFKGCSKSSSNVVFIKNWKFPNNDGWEEDNIYAYIVCDVNYREPFFFELACDQKPPSQRAAMLIKDYIDTLYNPCC